MENGMKLKGSCRCGAVEFTLNSHTPHPYMRCYCTICRKTAGGGGYAINIMGVMETLEVRGRPSVAIWQARLPKDEDDPASEFHTSAARRHFCLACASALWLSDPTWSENCYPFASAIDTKLPRPPQRVHIMLDFKAPWVVVPSGKNDARFDRYPVESIANWHKSRGLWVA
jgi:hypothetical protein